MKIIIKVKETTMICPSEETPHHSIWLSNLDFIARNVHTPNIYFYRKCGSSSGDDNFFNPDTLKDALSRALVPFYPVAGRFKLVDGSSSRPEVDCNAKGVVFVEAETPSVINDFVDFAPNSEMGKLIPAVDYSAGISSFPFMVFQLTFFRCGGVSLGVGTHHHFIDGPAVLDFMKTWSSIARGIKIDQAVTIPPFFDRTILRARNPPQPKFDHIEYHPSPQLLQKETSNNNTTSTTPEPEETAFKVLTISKDQMNTLVHKSNSKSNPTSRYEILAAHIWKCVCKARMLDHDQPTKLYMIINGRSRLRKPSLPPGYFGNATFGAALIRKAGHLISKPTPIIGAEIHDVLLQASDNEYLRSAIDYFEIQSDRTAVVRGGQCYASTNLLINSLSRIPFNTVDFGWGKPTFMGPVIAHPGVCFILPNPLNTGSLSLVIGLESEHVMNLFTNYFYQIHSRY